MSIDWVLYFVFIVTLGLLFCQSFSFTLWTMLGFFADLTQRGRWMISFLSSTLAYMTLFYLSDSWNTIIVVTMLLFGVETTYVLQEYFLRKFPHWERSAVLYLSLLFGVNVSLMMWLCFTIIIKTSFGI